MAETSTDLEQRIAALERAGGGRRVYGPLLRVVFPAADTQRDIAHGIKGRPTGVTIGFATAEIHATPGKLWTEDLAFLQANAANAEAVLQFYLTLEAPTDAF